MSSNSHKHADDTITIIDDESSTPHNSKQNWRILIVDDDEEVHTSTVYALSDQEVIGRNLEFLHAKSAREATTILAQENDIAVIFLDVVMESEHAGLELVRTIRHELGLTEVRIILRTGHPGYAPEIEAIRDYDINDYRTKSELTRTRLITSLTSALRSYAQIRTITYGRQGLEKIVRAVSELYNQHALEGLAEGVLIQLAGLLGLPPNGVVCALRGFPLDDTHSNHLYIVAGFEIDGDTVDPHPRIGWHHIVCGINRRKQRGVLCPENLVSGHVDGNYVAAAYFSILRSHVAKILNLLYDFLARVF